MKINKNLIKKLKPCQDRYENYLKYYKDKEFTPAQFMRLKNITHDDKCWVAVRLITKEKIRFAAADIAESVLHIYEKAYPGDNRPRLAIEAARRGSKGAVASAAFDAAYAAFNAAAFSAYDAANAAASAFSAADAAADAAANAAANAGEERKMQEKLIRKILLRYLK
jgi:hypothetical protein